jgi:hypothetical protein
LKNTNAVCYPSHMAILITVSPSSHTHILSLTPDSHKLQITYKAFNDDVL